MIGRDIFNIWAPRGAKWVEWVRPVPFVAINEDFKSYDVCEFIIPNITYINEVLRDTAIIVDLSDDEGIKEGIALAKIGFRPIPLYNGTEPQEGAMATIDNNVIEFGLIKGAMELQKITISNDAPPAFLLDSDRMHRYRMNESIFDNSWDIYPQDIPSAKYFLENGIDKIMVVGEKMQKDLKRILYKFQKEGIKISFVKRYEEPKEMVIRKYRL
jgi:hypothetical protein